MRPAWPLLAILLLMPALSGCANEPEEDWPGRDLEDGDPPWRRTMLGPGMGLEMDFALRSGTVLEYDWFTMDQTRIPFDIHIDHSTTELQGVFYQHTGPFTATQSAVHSLYWQNPGTSTVELWIQVEGEICYDKRCGTIMELSPEG